MLNLSSSVSVRICLGVGQRLSLPSLNKLGMRRLVIVRIGTYTMVSCNSRSLVICVIITRGIQSFFQGVLFLLSLMMMISWMRCVSRVMTPKGMIGRFVFSVIIIGTLSIIRTSLIF